MEKSNVQMNTLLSSSTFLSGISMLSCLMVVFVFFWAKYISQDITKRVSFQLTVTLSFIEALYSAAQIFNYEYSEPGVMCSMGVFLYVYFSLFSTILLTMMAVNLYLVFIKNLRKENIFWKYLLVSFLGSTLFAVPPAFLNAYGYDYTAKSCWFDRRHDMILTGLNETKLHVSPFKWLIYYIPTLLFVIIATFLSIRVMIKLYKAAKLNGAISNQNNKTGQRIQSKAQKVIQQLVSRLMFYPLVPLFCQFFNIYGEVDYMITAVNKFEFLVGALVGSSIQGLVTSILFFTIDPAFSKFWVSLRKSVSPNFVEDKLSLSGANTNQGQSTLESPFSSNVEGGSPWSANIPKKGTHVSHFV